VAAVLSAPLGSKPGRQYGVSFDLRSENWNIRDSFSGPAPLLGSLNLRREAVAAQFVDVVSGRWNWSAGGELSHRDFRSVIPGVALNQNLLARGYQLKQLAQVGAEIWDVPEKRITLKGSLSSEAGRIWSQPDIRFQAAAVAKITGSHRPATTSKSTPDTRRQNFGDVLDELFMLGLMGTAICGCAVTATRDGRKGRPIGTQLFSSNWEADGMFIERTAQRKRTILWIRSSHRPARTRFPQMAVGHRRPG
jgi:hypothetical protein